MSAYQDSRPGYHQLSTEPAIVLREPYLDDAAASLSWVSASDVVQYMGADFPEPSIEKENERIKEILSDLKQYSWMIERNGELIGNVCIHSVEEQPKKTGILTVLIGNKEDWGKGIGTKVCAAVIEWAFMETGFDELTARALQENIPSIKTLQKLGFTETGTEPYEGLVHGQKTIWRNFRIAQDDWSKNHV